MSTGKFTPQKVLNIKHIQNGKRIVLIQWKGLSIQHATWQPQNKFPKKQLQPLIQEYEQKRVNDKVRNFALKQTESLVLGENPYKETQRYGHFMYGDEPDSIESIKIFQNPQDSQERTTIVCEIKWKLRDEIDQFGQSSSVILQNSFMDSKTIKQFRPDFLIKNYQKLISLNVVPQKI